MSDLLTNMTLFDWLGVLGSLLVCAAYLAVANKWVASDCARFHLINLTGAGLLLLSLYFRPNAGAILIELIWAAIAIFSLGRLIFGQKERG